MRTWILLICCSSIIGAWNADTTSAGEASAQVLAEYPIRGDGDLLLVNVHIGKMQGKFIVDTGAALTVIDETFAKQHLMLARSQTEYPPEYPDMYVLPALALIDPNEPSPCDVAYVDLAAMHRASGHEIHGILGMDILKHYVLHINFDVGKLSILKSWTSDTGERHELQRDRYNRPTIQMELIDDRAVPMLVDTGMAVPGIGELDRKTFRKLLTQERLTLVGPEARAETLMGEQSGRKGLLDTLRMGRFQHQQMGVREGTRNALGLDFLSRYIVTIDLPNNLLYLEPGQRFREPAAFDMSGFTVVRREGKTVVERVYETGPACEKGIRAGDHLTQIDGEKTESYTLIQLRRLLARDAREVRLKFSRNGVEDECTLKLTNWQNVPSRFAKNEHPALR